MLYFLVILNYKMLKKKKKKSDFGIERVIYLREL